MLTSIKKLREIARRCQAGQVLDSDLAIWLAKSLESYLSRQCKTIEDAFGLHGPRGGVPWWLEEAIRQRDAALRNLAGRFFGPLSPSARAHQIYVLAVRYGASAWLMDRNRDDLPSYYRGRPQEWLWRAFKSGAPMPICERQLRNVLQLI